MTVMMASRVQGGIFTLMVVRVGDPYDPALDRDIAAQVARSPGFFSEAPVVLDLKDCLGCTAPADFTALKTAPARAWAHSGWRAECQRAADARGQGGRSRRLEWRRRRTRAALPLSRRRPRRVPPRLRAPTW